MSKAILLTSIYVRVLKINIFNYSFFFIDEKHDCFDDDSPCEAFKWQFHLQCNSVIQTIVLKEDSIVF